MPPSPIDLTPLRRALDALAGALHYWQAEPDGSGRKPQAQAIAEAARDFLADAQTLLQRLGDALAPAADDTPHASRR